MNPVERQRIFWHLALMRVPGVGAVTAKKLFDKFGEPQNSFKAGQESLKEILNKSALDGFLRYDPAKDETIEKELDSIEKNGIVVLTLLDEEYPRLLKKIFDPPPILYVKGLLTPRDDVAIGIVGTRRPTNYGRDQAKRFAQYLVGQGITIVSGMALGIDGIAQLSAIESGGRTIAVLGSGVDVVYPSQHRELWEKIAQNGAVVSEFPMGTKPLGEYFPRRNRIISGLSLGIFIVEGGKKSGAMITATSAVEQGREVYALPGPVNMETSDGPNELIRQGATPVCEPSQIIETLGIPELAKEAKRKALDLAEGLTGSSKILFDIIQFEPKHIDVIAREANMSTQHALATIFELEMRELIRRQPGMLFTRNV